MSAISSSGFLCFFTNVIINLTKHHSDNCSSFPCLRIPAYLRIKLIAASALLVLSFSLYNPGRRQMIIKYIVSTALELIAITTALVTYPIDATRCDKKNAHFFKGQTPILLVHGYFHNSSAWLLMRHRLNSAGLGPVYTVNLGWPFHSITEYAEVLKKKVRLIQLETGCTRLRLIGHSMGGLVCEYYATAIAPAGSVESIITLGSPLQGTKMSVLAIGKCVREMSYRSDFSKKLDQQVLCEGHIRRLHLASETDLIIRPTSAALPLYAKGDDSQSQNYTFDCLGHVSFLYSRSVVDKIVEFYGTTH